MAFVTLQQTDLVETNSWTWGYYLDTNIEDIEPRLHCHHPQFTPHLETTLHFVFPPWHQQHTGDNPRADKTMWWGTTAPADQQGHEKQVLEQVRWPDWGPNNMWVSHSSQRRGTSPSKTTQHSSSTALPGAVFNYSAIKSPVSFALTFLCDWKYFTPIHPSNLSPGCL